MNKAKLMYEMNLRGVGINDICSEIGMSRSAFYRKSRGISQFTLEEISKIMCFLDSLSHFDNRAAALEGIFFGEKVS